MNSRFLGVHAALALYGRVLRFFTRLGYVIVEK